MKQPNNTTKHINNRFTNIDGLITRAGKIAHKQNYNNPKSSIVLKLRSHSNYIPVGPHGALQNERISSLSQISHSMR